MKYKYDPKLKSSMLQEFTLKPRVTTDLNKNGNVLLLLRDTSENLLMRNIYDNELKSWITLSNIKFPFIGRIQSFTSTASAYIIFNCNPELITIDKKTLITTKHPTMSVLRNGCAIVMVNGFIYAMGGCQRELPSNIVERCPNLFSISKLVLIINSDFFSRYDIQQQRWENCSKMLAEKRFAIATSLSDQIFCCGHEVNDRIEYCKLEIGEWKYLPVSDVKSAVNQLITHNGQLFIVRSRSIEQYDPTTGTYLMVSVNPLLV